MKETVRIIVKAFLSFKCAPP